MKHRNYLLTKIVFLTLLFVWGGKNLHSQQQSVYTLNLGNDIVLSTFGAVLFVGSFFVDDQASYPYYLNKDKINSFDRFFFPDEFREYKFFKNALQGVIPTLPVMVPLLVAGLNFKEEHRLILTTWLTYGVMYAQAFMFNYGTRQLLGNIISRHRPFHYGVEYLDKPTPPNTFPSGTTSMVFVPAAFLTTTFWTEFPDSPWKIPIMVGSFSLASTVGVLRVLSGHHFATDVIAGAVLGSFYGWLIPTIHKRKDENVSIHPTGNGVLVSIRY